MKIFCLLLFAVMALLSPKVPETFPPTTSIEQSKSVPAKDSIVYSWEIQPILEKGCSPCHFPGGKMYDPMPFDQAKTILDHKSGMLKRFNKPEEKQLMERFFAEQIHK
ncbi:MAG: hypothetical protein ACKVU0_00700 [Saprospiraceae bacterium]